MTTGKSSRKELTHDRILEAAARAIRRAGYEGVGVADIMKEAGLTHGGYYAHFSSGRDSKHGLAQRAAALQEHGFSPFRALIEAYLSDAHLKAAETGCPVAALSSEMPRQPDEVREASGKRVRGLIAVVQQALPTGAQKTSAMAVTSAMVGALQLARTLGDNAAGRAILAATRQSLIEQYDGREDKDTRTR